MARYEYGKVYQIVNDVDDKVYVGSTCKKYLSQRMVKHKSDYARFVAGTDNGMKIYNHMQAIGYEHFHIELIRLVPCACVEELRRAEGEAIRELKPALNVRIAGRTQKERRNDTKDIIILQSKQYYEANKDRICARVNEYRNKNKEVISVRKSQVVVCECGGSSTNAHMSRHRTTNAHKFFEVMDGLNQIQI